MLHHLYIRAVFVIQCHNILNTGSGNRVSVFIYLCEHHSASMATLRLNVRGMDAFPLWQSCAPGDVL